MKSVFDSESGKDEVVLAGIYAICYICPQFKKWGSLLWLVIDFRCANLVASLAMAEKPTLMVAHLGAYLCHLLILCPCDLEELRSVIPRFQHRVGWAGYPCRQLQ